MLPIKNYVFNTLRLQSTQDLVERNVAAFSVAGGAVIGKGLKIGYTNNEKPGNIRYNRSIGKFQGYIEGVNTGDANMWVNFNELSLNASGCSGGGVITGALVSLIPDSSSTGGGGFVLQNTEIYQTGCNSIVVPGSIYGGTASGSEILVFGAPSINFGMLGSENKMFFNKQQAAFRTGICVNSTWDVGRVGTGSFASGQETIASGLYSVCVGAVNTAAGDFSICGGSFNQATGTSSVCFGINNSALERASTCFGQGNVASGFFSLAQGTLTIASGSSSHAEGQQSQASGLAAHAEGFATISSGIGSHSEGYLTRSSATGTHTEGFLTEASGNFSHSEGTQTKALGDASHAQGFVCVATGTASFAGGNNAYAIHDRSFVWGAEPLSDTLSKVNGGGIFGGELYVVQTGSFEGSVFVNAASALDSYTLPKTRDDPNSFLILTGSSGETTWQPSKSYGSLMYVNASPTTLIYSNSTAQNLSTATFISSINNYFTSQSSNQELKYDGATTKPFKIDYTATLSYDASLTAPTPNINANFYVGSYVNNVLVNSSIQTALVATSPIYTFTISGTHILLLNSGDVVKIMGFPSDATFSSIRFNVISSNLCINEL